MSAKIIKLILFLIDLALVAGLFAAFFSLKKYLKKHSNEIVEDNEKQIKAYTYSIFAIGILLVILGIAAFVLGVFAKIDL